jgi:NAD(P)-dependent dehydrogenase (short-subunit alcohol dehydrogenase family)
LSLVRPLSICRAVRRGLIVGVGGNAGIGFELVKALASKPEIQKVYLAARSVKSGQDAQ